MISIKRNSKGHEVEATGVRTRKSSIYSPNQSESFRISRSKFSDFLSCPRCFYLDRVKGLASPSTPGWSLNETTDLLLKKEFDVCRAEQIPHRLFILSGLNNVVPYDHPDMDDWRDSLHHGLEYQVNGSNIVLHGGVDDVWFDLDMEELIVVDYKSQASNYPVNTDSYLASTYHQGYKIQMDVYAYLLTKMGFPVSPTAYFYVCNGDRNALEFNGQISFTETLVPYDWDTNWIDRRLVDMTSVLNSNELPDSNPACENCAYSRQRATMESWS